MQPDSSHHESALNKESPFLSREDWRSDIFLPPIDINVMLAEGFVYSPNTVINALERANYCLTTFPGPHLEERKMYAEKWLGWWIEELKEDYSNSFPGFPFVKTFNVLNFGSLSDELEKRTLKDYIDGNSLIPAVWFVAGLEGHEGHRYAIDAILRLNHILPIIVFEQEVYMKGKKRDKFFLPEELRLSMYSHYFRKRGNKVILTLNPYSSAPVKQMNEIYEWIFNKLHALVCLPNKNDPDGTFQGKLERSVFFPIEWAIPFLDVPSTTERVRV